MIEIRFFAQHTEQGGDAPDTGHAPPMDLPEEAPSPQDQGDCDDLPFTGEDMEDTGEPRRRRPDDPAIASAISPRHAKYRWKLLSSD